MVRGQAVHQDQSPARSGRSDLADAGGHVGRVEGVFRWVEGVVRDFDYYLG